MTSNPVPCKPDCPHRSAICHGKVGDEWRCSEWGKYKEKQEKDRESRYADNERRFEIARYYRQRKSKVEHREHRRTK